jgi:hypothetical protein
VEPALGLAELGPPGSAIRPRPRGLPDRSSLSELVPEELPQDRSRARLGGGEDLDRFSKYQFGFFGGSRVHGYQIGKVRAEEAYAAHTSYGFELGKMLRLDAVVDAAWATDKASGLDRSTLRRGCRAPSSGRKQDTLVQIGVRHPGRRPRQRDRRLRRLPEALQLTRRGDQRRPVSG